MRDFKGTFLRRSKLWSTHRAVRTTISRDTPPIATTYAYKCKCGVAFTFEVKHDQPPK